MGGTGLTVTVISSVVLSKPSFALSRSTYMPACEKLTVVLAAFALAKVAVPGPLTLLHWRRSAAGGLGKPSSLAAPVRLALLGKVIVWSGPALTTGRWLIGGAGLTVTVISSVVLSKLSFAVSRST